MLQENEIARRLHEYMSERITGIKVREVRIGVEFCESCNNFTMSMKTMNLLYGLRYVIFT